MEGSRKKILFVGLTMAVGGVEMSLLALLKSLSPEKFDIHLALIRPGNVLDSEIPEYVTVHPLPEVKEHIDRDFSPVKSIVRDLKRLRVVSAVKTGLATVKSLVERTRIPYFDRFWSGQPHIEGEYDVAISYNGPMEALDWYVARYVKARRKIGWIHFDVSKFFNRLETCRRAYGAYDRVYIVSDGGREEFDKRYPELSDRSAVFHNLVDHQRVRRLGEEAVAKEFDRTKKHIVTVGRTQWLKGYDLVIDAAEELKSRGVEFVWHCIGGGFDFEEIKARARERGLANDIDFTGTIMNPYSYMSRADVYVQPSHHEGYCITLAEAKNFKAPIVSTRFSGVEQLDGREGSVIVDHDGKAIADGVEKAIAHGLLDNPGQKSDNQELDRLIEYLES